MVRSHYPTLTAYITRNHSSRIRTTRLPTICASVSTICQHQGVPVWGEPGLWVSVLWGSSWTILTLSGGVGSLCGEVQCIMANGHMGPSVNRQTDTRDLKHYLPATSSEGGKNLCLSRSRCRVVWAHITYRPEPVWLRHWVKSASVLVTRVVVRGWLRLRLRLLLHCIEGPFTLNVND